MQKIDSMPNFRATPTFIEGVAKFKIQKRISFLFISFWVNRGTDSNIMSYPIICDTVEDAEEKIAHLSKSVYYIQNQE